MARPRKQPDVQPTAEDPDVGPTRKTPSTEERLQQTELATRALKLQHQRKQAEMTEEANAICAFPQRRRAA